MAVTKPLLVFPLAIMIVMALLGIFVVGLNGGAVHVAGVANGYDIGTHSILTNGVTNGMEPLGGIIGTDENTTTTASSQAQDYNLVTFIIITTALGAAILAAIAIGTIAGVNIFGSGLNSSVSSTILQYGTLSAIWLVLSAASSVFFFSATPMAIGLVFYAILTICYLIGTVLHVQGSTA